MQRRWRAAFPLSVEHLEPRHLLAGMIDLPELRVEDEPRDEPAVVLEGRCIVVDVEDAPAEPAEEREANLVSDAGDRLLCNQAFDAILNSVTVGGDDSPLANRIEPPEIHPPKIEPPVQPFEPQQGILNAHPDRSTPNAVSIVSGSTVEEADALDTDLDAGDLIPRRTAADTSASISPHSGEASANAGSSLTNSAVTVQPSLYFSGSTALSGASWKASDEKLASAASLFDVMGPNEILRTAATDTVAAKTAASLTPVEPAATSARSWKAGSADNELTSAEVAFAQVHSWPTRDELPSLPLTVVRERPGQPPVERLVEVSLQITSDATEVATTSLKTGKPMAHELVTANIASPLGRLHSWCLLGGIGIWQVIISARGRQRKLSGENLA